MGRHDHLKVVAQCEFLEVQHEQLLDPRVQACLDRVDQNQCTFELGDLHGQPQHCALACGHVQFGVTRAGSLTGE